MLLIDRLTGNTALLPFVRALIITNEKLISILGFSRFLSNFGICNPHTEWYPRILDEDLTETLTTYQGIGKQFSVKSIDVILPRK